MLVEGRGNVQPVPVRIFLPPWTIQRLREAAETREVYRGYARRADAWGRGLTRLPSLPGLVGEEALSQYLTKHGFPVRVDLELRPRGDGGCDFVIHGLIVQLKTRQRHNVDSSLIRRGTEDGDIKPLVADVFVFAEWCGEGNVDLLGWQWSDAIREQSPFQRSPAAHASHWNLEVPNIDFLPMHRLLEELEARQ